MDITLDFDIYHWKLGERMAFEKATGMTCERAVTLFAKAGEDEEAALDVPASVQAGFVWIAARRQKPEMTFDQAADCFDGQDFIDAIPEVDEADVPLVNREARRTTKKSSGRSATRSTTPPPKSAS